MEYGELKQIFQELKRTSPREDLTAHIIFTEDSFVKECQRRCDFVIFRRTGNVRKWRVKVCSL